ncbi:class II fructose-bisphosphate aldolase [Thermoanaerobacterium thermosaccharolyticum]|uniref:Ketose-bisphosphate aldolase n=1 Tax=Thermoanaerobacterium thermosaccharolyticum M0795 TaxID=698948 RepID=L0IKK0_THETR|nr:class II fructose-bisphosphate aldolase [Thermoanaerobacterium thermosaccharolyticum]AGB19358.1 ketose-bisphosphate aldolase [Thermoanaerobacterium thermosaccharolyticum M0795]
MLVPMKNILDIAKSKGYGVAAPNVWELYSIKAAIEAATEEKSPIILDFHSSMGDIFEFSEIAKFMAKKASIPIAINLDHGQTFEDAIKAIRAGFTSVMVDRSTLSFEENITEVREIVKIAHAAGISVEAELGHVGSGQMYEVDRTKGLTDPNKAKEFVDRTGIDCLAVAIGTAHGLYKGIPHIDIDRLKEIKNKVDIPLVLHGGSNTGDENLKNAVKNGISKVNLFTDLSISGRDSIINYIKTNDKASLLEIFKAGFDGYKQKLKYYIKLFK